MCLLVAWFWEGHSCHCPQEQDSVRNVLKPGVFSGKGPAGSHSTALAEEVKVVKDEVSKVFGYQYGLAS